MHELEDILGDYRIFLTKILSRVVVEGFNMADFVQIDHMCYRTISKENYNQKKAQLTSIATLLGETKVNGRPISTFRLKQPVIHDSWRIDAIELPAPKEGSKYAEGLEHVEFVIYDDIPTFLKKYKDKPFETRSADRGINPEISLKLDELSVGFHLLSLPTVLYLENKLGISEVRDGK